MIIDRAAHAAMIRHMQEAAPHEGVGLLAGPQDRPNPPGGQWQAAAGAICDQWVPQTNVSEFPRVRFEVDPGQTLDTWEVLTAAGRRPWVVCHSHTTTSAVPSLNDIRYAVDPSLLHMIVSLAGHPLPPTAWLWRIDSNAVGPDRCHRVRYQVIDLGFQAERPTDLTHGVTGPSV